MGDPSAPLVSLAVPLYASRRFFGYIVENLATQDYPNLEIIVSDRHGLDDTLARLRARFAGDTRFSFVESRDRIGWVEHYNDLLRRASGRYVLWMPHDDSYPPSYISQLVARLEQDPELIAAFGRHEPVDLDGNALPKRVAPPPPFSESEPWSPRIAVRLLTTWRLGVAFRGVFRRDALVRSGLFIRPTDRGTSADVFWVFGVAVAGRLGFVPSCCLVKRFYATSTHARNPRSLRNAVLVFPILRSYLHGHPMNWSEAARLNSVLFCWSAYQVLLQLIPFPGRIPQVARRALRALLA